ncbi:hypothetical protein TMEC54S_00328 [Thauera mechernichensis]|uniref:hypothetical protein n=1 Tax=Thauera sp. 27 TaxID=305700 RepID=UPI0018DEE178|nr:hypothetical protein [Thauera sp. 27]
MQTRMRYFCQLVTYCYKQLPTVDAAVQVVQAKDRYAPILRSAALRNLIRMAPLEVTRGQPYLQARRLVRQHYGV